MTVRWTADLNELTGAPARPLTASLLAHGTAGAVSGEAGAGLETATGSWPARMRDLLHDVAEAAATPGGMSPARTRR
ncbi:MAG TPA: hypothetical protein VK576_00235 [Thermoleophilia bacterium]|nr:hypothetical protein [Thermoleophilia bacterium]